MEVWEEGITRLIARMQVSGMNSMTVLVEVFLREVFQVMERTFYSTRGETE
jgi:hypothetical protein